MLFPRSNLPSRQVRARYSLPYLAVLVCFFLLSKDAARYKFSVAFVNVMGIIVSNRKREFIDTRFFPSFLFSSL
jgi:hypothetical protein